MSDAKQTLRLLGEMERLERTVVPGPTERRTTPTESSAMAALLATLVETDFDLGRTVVDSAHGN